MWTAPVSSLRHLTYLFQSCLHTLDWIKLLLSAGEQNPVILCQIVFTRCSVHWGVFTLAEMCKPASRFPSLLPMSASVCLVCLYPAICQGPAISLRPPGSTELVQEQCAHPQQGCGTFPGSLQGKHLTVKIILSYSAVLGLLYLILTKHSWVELPAPVSKGEGKEGVLQCETCTGC